MTITFNGYYGHPIRHTTDGENTWQTVERLYEASCPPWHNARLVRIERHDKGAAYNAPGVFTCGDREGYSFVVELSA